MDASGQPASNSAKLARLLRFLERDPENPNLLADAASTALDESEIGQARALLARYRMVAEPSPAILNLEGLAALREGLFDKAATVFAALHSENPGDAAIRFNLAWAKAMQGLHEEVVPLLDDSVIEAVPRAAGLKVQSLHHLGRLEDALACGQGLRERLSDDPELMGALALAAIDAEEVDLARFYAERSADNQDGLVTLGSLVLGEDDPDRSLALFDRALARSPDHARALLGKGLSLLAKGEAGAASDWIDRGAKGFGDHIGSWIAAGWAHYAIGAHATARERFERALALDDAFAESHGALAVADIAAGDIEKARKRTEVALRLDRRCLSGALAQSLLAAHDGDPAAAERIRGIALSQPVGYDGRTIAEIAVELGQALRRRS